MPARAQPRADRALLAEAQGRLSSPPPTRLFVPGYAARASAYARGLPEGWEALQPGSARSLTELRDWLVSELDARPAPALLAGHSMGAALAVLAAALAPERVSELVLLAPAGVPLDKPLTASLRELGRQLAGRIHRLPELVASAAHLLRDPVGAVRVERELRMLDLSAELETLRSRGMPAVVIGCSTDTLIPVQDCRSIAEALGARYREVALDWGHVWMLADPPALARELAELA